MGRAKELTKNTLIITIGRVSTQFVSFLLLPLYTTLLSTAEYGTVDFIITLVNLLIPVVSIMTDQGAFRFLLNCEGDEDRTQTISSAFCILLATGLITAVAGGLIGLLTNNHYVIWLILILLATAFNNLFLQTARGLHHTTDYALGSFICSSVTITLNVVCIAGLKMGANGMLTASFVGNAICCLFLYLKLGIGRYLSLKEADKETAGDILKYSAPLVPHQLSLWVMNSSDRIIVTMFLGAAANGVLAITHKFPLIYMTFYNIFQLAWHETGAVHFFDEDRDEFFTDIVNRLLMLFSALCLGVIVILPLIFDLLVKADFKAAYYNIPIYMAASLCNVVVGLLGVVYVATKKTSEIAKTTMIAAAVNIIVNLALIKHIGLYAASLSTFAGFFITMVYRVIDTRKYLTIRYDRKRIAVMLTAVLAGCAVYYMRSVPVSLITMPVFIAVAWICNRDTLRSGLEALREKHEKKKG